MKKIILLLSLLLIVHLGHTQFLKKVLGRVKDEADMKTQNKAIEKEDKGLDSIYTLPKKIVLKKKNKTKSDSPVNKKAKVK